MYEAGVKDDKFLMMALSNKKCNVAVKTPWGSTSKRVEMTEIEMQGTVPAPIKCSVQLDSLGKECLQNGEGLYKYKECLNIPPLLMLDDAIAVSDCGPETVKMNALIQNKVNMKSLRLGHSKCFKMHVGKNASCCPTLKVQDKLMLTSNRERYLGDILTTDCKINSNIEERYNKGIGIVNQISSILKEISFGHNYFEMAVMFRQSMLVNSILCNSEVLYGLNKSHIEKLESVDTYLWRNIFSSKISTPKESYFIEANCIPFRFIIMARRLMYYWSLLHKDDTELAKRAFQTQKLLPVKNDWVLQLQSDLTECKITLSEEAITNMKKEPFKNLIKKQIKMLSMEYLIKLREKHSKSENLMLSDRMKGYLKTQKISVEEKKLLFAMKTRQVNVKTNYRNDFSDMLCRLCAKPEELESELHLMCCEKLVNENNIKEELSGINYSDIFGSLEKQISAIKVWKKILKLWNVKLEAAKLSPSGRQVHLSVGQSDSCTDIYSSAYDSTINVYGFG